MNPLSRGRPPNVLRDAARAAGEKFFADAVPCPKCGTNRRYAVNGNCVQCAIDRGSQRYANLDEAGQLQRRAKDHARYLNAKTAALLDEAPAANDNVPDDFLAPEDDA